MKKNNLKILFYLPFLLSFTFLLRIPLSENSSINVLDILLTIVIIIGVWLIIKEKQLLEFWNYWVEKQFFKTLLLLIFILGIIISLTFNYTESNIINSLGLIKSFIFLPILFSVILSFFIRKKYLNISDLLKYFFISISTLSLFSIFIIFAKKLTFDNRLSLFYDSPNHLAMILAPSILIGIWFLLFKKSFLKKNKQLVILFIFLLSISLFFTKSLGAIIAILVSMLFLFLSKLKSLKLIFLFKLIVLLIMIISFTLILNTSFFVNKTSYSPAVPPSSTNSRVAIYQASEKIAKDTFPWGIGIGNFQKKYLAYQEYFTPYPQWAVPHAHNNLFHIYTEIGILSILSFFSLLILQIFKKQKKPGKILAFVILIYFLIHGIFDTTIWHNDSAFLFWTMLLII